MELRVKRMEFGKDYTVGTLYINGTRFSDVLEDCDRGLTQDMTSEEIKAKKVYGQTAIPKGTYGIDMDTVSQKFKDRSWAKPYGGKLPRLEDVPGYDGVLIHVGNSSSDTEGCLLVGESNGKGMVSNSTATFQTLMAKYLLPAKVKGDKITVTIE